MPDNPFISIIIALWNSSKHLQDCLDSLALQTYHNFEVIAIDNNSTDDTINILEAHTNSLKKTLIRLNKNIGFAAANNLGASLARGTWLVLLNADAFPQPEWLYELVAASEARPEMSCFSSRQLQNSDPRILDGAGDAYHVSGFAWRMGLGYPAEQYGLLPAEIFSPCAAAAMYLRQAFLEVGGFDEDFFSYFEDVDLGFRMQLKGYRSMYVPSAVVRHVGSATFGVRSDFAFYYSHRNLVWTFFKSMPNAMLLRYLPQHMAANLIYLLYYTLRGRGKVLWKAKWDALMGLLTVLKKRREIQSTRRISNRDLLNLMQKGLLQPYLLGYHLRRVLRNS